MSSASGSVTSTPPGDVAEFEQKFTNFVTRHVANAERLRQLLAVNQQKYTLTKSSRVIDNTVDEGKKRSASGSPTKKGGKRVKGTDGAKLDAPEEPARLLTGATLKPYQQDGVEWLAQLHLAGVSCILADEMGLGKTIQTIAFIAILREQSMYGPVLVVCPKAVVHNWCSEFERFTPDIPVVCYYGTPAERKKLQKEVGMPEGTAPKEFVESMPDEFWHTPTKSAKVIVTTFEMFCKDKRFFKKFGWSVLVVDEGQRLKNKDGTARNQLKELQCEQRIILTGTPLQNNLLELYSLLNFLDPMGFPKPDIFDMTYGASATTSSNSGPSSPQSGPTSEDTTAMREEERWQFLAKQLHEILHPRMLRRLKTEVELDLPLKKEYVLRAPMTEQQKTLTEQVMAGTIRDFLIARRTIDQPKVEVLDDSDDDVIIVEPANHQSSSPRRAIRAQIDAGKRKRPSRGRHQIYTLLDNDDDNDDEEDDAFFERLAEKVVNVPQSMADIARIGQEHHNAKARSSINNMSLKNACMQLRKVANHPFLFDWPTDPATGHDVVNHELLAASGKMMLLERLLVTLFKTGHKVLLFSQFTSMLDIIHDWVEDRGWRTYRIDGQMALEMRTEQMDEFNTSKGPDGIKLFLLSTRAGGVGVNLTAADTVIFFDSDWNPQQDLQAMARAHRIGQTKPVLVFRLVTANSIEEKMLDRARSKRKLESLVIAKGKFQGKYQEYGNMDLLKNNKRQRQSMMATFVEDLANEQKEVHVAQVGDTLLTDQQLAVLLDRSDATMRDLTTHSKKMHKVGRVAFEAIQDTETAKEEPRNELDDLLEVEEDEEE